MSIFTNIKELASKRGISFQKNARQAKTWFANKAKSLGGNISGSRLMSQTRTRQVGRRPDRGNMVHFVYDPKTKKQLPFYDKFPLIFIVEVYKDGFLGINLHYLPPGLRLKLLEKLTSLQTNKKYDDRTKLRLSYRVLTATSRFKEFQPTIKRYLTSHVRSRFLKIDANEWHMAIFLPTSNFAKASNRTVWNDSRRKI